MRMADPQYVMKLETRLMAMEKKLQEHDSTSRQANRETAVAEGVSRTRGQSFSDNFQEEFVIDSPYALVGDSTTTEADHEVSHNKDTDQLKFRVSVPRGKTQLAGFNDLDLDQMLYHCTDDLVPEEPSGLKNNPEDVSSLPRVLVEVLVSQFYRETYSIFPIIREPEFRQQLDQWASNGEDRSGFVPVLYALLAVSAFILPSDHAVFELSEVKRYKSLDLGDLISSHASSQLSFKSYKADKLARVNSVVAHGLLSLYLAEAGQVTEAWVTTGHAVRLYQGLDLYGKTRPDLESFDAPSGHGAVWWCLYILDRSLSTVLLKPLAIDDVECDVSSNDDGESHVYVTEDAIDPWFSVITDFHITMGKIYKSVRSIRRFQNSGHCNSNEILRSRLKNHDIELEQYFQKQVLPNMRNTPDEPRRMGLQTIAVSSYFICVVLLYRQFIEAFRLEDSRIYLRCAEAASNCIRLTPKVLDTVPASHFMIQHSRSIYISSKVLLHCMRVARNEDFSTKAWDDVEMGLDMLQKIKIQWPEIKRYQKLTEEDMRQTRIELDRHEAFRRTFDNFASVSGDEIYTRLSSCDQASIHASRNPVTENSGKRGFTDINEDAACDTQFTSRRENPSAQRDSANPDLLSLFQTGGGEMENDGFTMSFMLDVAALSPATALAPTSLCGNADS
ncbi:hypothetical protein ED733_000238 [Metarhizium rileyi]|uniref:Xylanolytic transcriptional activator regulatory domain-containing protein n=1 Tax=Metarhizium rileyi (strain RCEF 4871) TaxID=1649241 RepID=A0A5C6G2N6_METRR|nr:hypothetical protein ED733_000238 [Metarhizium rileyi]